MIGGGGKIGGPPAGPPRIDIPQGEQAPAAKAPQGTAPKAPAEARDGFEKATATRSAVAQGPSVPKDTPNLQQLAKENPAAARQMAATMASQVDANAAKVQQEMAGAKATLEQLGAKRFAKAALEEKRAELRRRRDKLASMKTRLRMGARKMALLQQVAGQLDQSDLEEELERLLKHHSKLSTAWGKAHHLLDSSELFFCSDDDTPEHLKEVVKAEVRAGMATEQVAESMEKVSPRRVIAALIARTLDGSVPDSSTSDDTASGEGAPERWDVAGVGSRGEHGPTLQTWSAMSKIMLEALDRDALARPPRGRDDDSTED